MLARLLSTSSSLCPLRQTVARGVSITFILAQRALSRSHVFFKFSILSSAKTKQVLLTSQKIHHNPTNAFLIITTVKNHKSQQYRSVRRTSNTTSQTYLYSSNHPPLHTARRSVVYHLPSFSALKTFSPKELNPTSQSSAPPAKHSHNHR